MVLNQTLRDNARRQLGNNIFAETWLMITLACFIVSAVTGAASAAFAPAVFLLSGPLYYGLYRLILNKISFPSKPVELADLFKAFTECFAQSFLLYLLKTIFIALWSLLFVIPGIVKSYVYSMAEYVLQDQPSKTWREALDESKTLTEGYKMQLFMLDLSFIGWYFLGALCFGIGILFVIPYHQTARANFYLARKAEIYPAAIASITTAADDFATPSDERQDDRSENNDQ